MKEAIIIDPKDLKDFARKQREIGRRKGIEEAIVAIKSKKVPASSTEERNKQFNRTLDLVIATLINRLLERKEE